MFSQLCHLTIRITIRNTEIRRPAKKHKYKPWHGFQIPAALLMVPLVLFRVHVGNISIQVLFSEMELFFSSEVYYDVTRLRWWRHTYGFMCCFLSRFCPCWVMLPTKLNELSKKKGRRPLCYIFSPIGFCENARPNWKEFTIMHEKSLIFHFQNFYYPIRYKKRTAFFWKLDINVKKSKFFTCTYKEYNFIKEQEIRNGT
jgi:hypothetical protein